MELFMKRIAYVFLTEVVLAGMLVAVSGAQSEPLGDYARSIRKGDKTAASAKKYDNDNLPSSDNISVVGNATDSTGPEDANPAPEANSAKPENGATPSAPSQDATKKTDPNDAWKQKIAQKQKAVDDAKKALDDLKEQARKAGVPAKLRE